MNNKIKTSCAHCGILFELTPSEVKRGRKCCSRVCGGINQRNKIKIFCDYCNIAIYVWPSQIKRGTKYCSLSCAGRKNFKDNVLTPQEIFFRNISKTEHENGCWIYSVIDCYGYGRLKINGKVVRAHRYSYELHNGEIPDNMMICHSCDTPSCVRPSHLFIGTAKDNIQDMINKGRKNVLKGEEYRHSKLTEEQVIQIRLLTAGEDISQEMIGNQFGVSRRMVNKIKNGKAWKHIP